jgi:hypothetical protein
VRRGLIIGAALLALAGCGGGGSDKASTTTAPRGAGSGQEAKTIRAWIAALNAGDADKAAGYFVVPGGIIQQTKAIKLKSKRQAVAFNASLPCRGTVTDVKKDGAYFLAAFKLRPGKTPGGGCEGTGVRVRFKFRDGKFLEWRQLPASDAPTGQSA